LYLLMVIDCGGGDLQRWWCCYFRWLLYDDGEVVMEFGYGLKKMVLKKENKWPRSHRYCHYSSFFLLFFGFWVFWFKNCVRNSVFFLVYEWLLCGLEVLIFSPLLSVQLLCHLYVNK
jgi:hypothetical protein